MLQLLRRNSSLLLFGILTAAFSGPGQTFLVSQFITPMRVTFDLSQSAIAAIYSAATLISALILPFHGRLLDRMRLSTFTLASGVLLAIGCIVLSQSAAVWMIFIGFFLIRNLGQGTLGMISSTTMARTFGRQRGKALGIANIGYPLSEAVFPFLLATWILHYGWRSGWILLAALILLFFAPVALILLKRSDQTLKLEEALEESSAALEEDLPIKHWRAGEVLRDWRYYALQIPLLVPPAFLTALFFHQEAFIRIKGWDMQTASAFFIAFALSRGGLSLMIGPWVDKLSARRIFPFVLLPMAAGLLGYAFGQVSYWFLFFLTGAGITMGLSMTVTGAMWAELYGTKYLGSIKGMQSSLMVLSTAITPPLFGAFLDRGFEPVKILCGMFIYILLAVTAAWLLCRSSYSKGAESRAHMIQ